MKKMRTDNVKPMRKRTEKNPKVNQKLPHKVLKQYLKSKHSKMSGSQ
jgi:hypothetical protein